MAIYTKLSNGQKYNETTTTTDKVSDLEQVYFLKNVFSETTGPVGMQFSHNYWGLINDTTDQSIWPPLFINRTR